MADNRLIIGITQGDTNGIGWEIILKTLADQRICEICTPLVYGSEKAADHYRRTIAEFENFQFHVCSSAADIRRGRVNIIPCGDPELRIEAGQQTAAAGKAATDALLRAADDLADGRIDALVTAPINKMAMQSDEFRFTGHTEFLADRLGGQPMMIMCSDRLRVGLATVHLPLSEVSKSLSKETLVDKMQLLRKVLKQDFGVVEPRIAVLSLNPHNGDSGLLGAEENDIIKPAVTEACESGVLAFGPFSADGFFASGNYARYDAVLAMYHDQGLAPFKVISPDGVNFTAGLSKVRTSPDHGTGFDIAGMDKADPQSMRNAIFAAIDIVEKRRAWAEWSARPLEHFERDKGRDVSVKDLKLAEE